MIQQHLQFELQGKKTFEKAIVKPPFRFATELPDEACFYYTVQGCVGIHSPAGFIEGTAKEGVVMRCGAYINDFLANESTGICEVVAVHFYPEVLRMIYDEDLLTSIGEVENVEALPHKKVPSSILLKNYIDSLQFYFDNPALVSEELLKLKMRELLLLLAKTDNLRVIKVLLASLFNPLKIDFRTIIESNLYNNLKSEELAHLAGLSLSSFKREFVKQYGASPAKYIRIKKLEKAAQMLKSTEVRVSDIAYDCGFNDLAHFSKTFQKHFGSAPTAYRNI